MSQPQEVVLSTPASPEFLRVARVTASGLASRLGFSIDEVDDLRLALDELCYALIGKQTEVGTLELRYLLLDDQLIIEGCADRPPDPEALALGELSRQILSALVDDHALWEDGNQGHFSLKKQRLVKTS